MKIKLITLIEKQRALVNRISINIEQLGKAASELRDVSIEEASSSIQQAGSAQEAGITSEEIKATSGIIAERANAVSEMASEIYGGIGKSVDMPLEWFNRRIWTWQGAGTSAHINAIKCARAYNSIPLDS